MFPCEICEISKNTFFNITPSVATTVKAVAGVSATKNCPDHFCNLTGKPCDRVFLLIKLHPCDTIEKKLRHRRFCDIFLKSSFYGILCEWLHLFLTVRTMTATLLKKRLWHTCFPVIFAKFLKTPFLHNTFGRLLLNSENTEN